MQPTFKVLLVVLGLSQLFSFGQSNQLSAWLNNDKTLSPEDSKIMVQWLLDNGLKAEDFKVIEPPRGHSGDFSVIVAEQSIQSIRASGVKVMAGLSQLSHLQSLQLSHFKQTDLSACPAQIKSLRVTGDELASLSGAQGCEQLEEIKVVHSLVASINPLLGLPKLTSIIINYSQLSSVEIDHSAPALGFLDLSDNQITHFAIQAHLPNLEILSLDNNQLSTWVHNNQTPRLKALSISNNLIQDLTSVIPIRSLERITLKGNPFNDLTALTAWPQLKSIQFDRNLSNQNTAINSKIKQPTGPFELHTAEAEYLKQSYLNKTEFIETLPKSTGGTAQGVAKKISSHFDLHSDPTVSGAINMDTLNGLMRLPVVSTDDLLQYDRKIVMRGTARVEQGSLIIYSPVEEDFWSMAKLFVDTPIKQRPKDRDDLVIKGFAVNRVTAGEPVEFNANLVAIAGKYFLLLGPEQGEVSGVNLEFE
jgi:hypothetical protein